MKDSYEIIVIGGGHAGVEAASAAARMGCQTLMLTMSADAIGRMSCNPAIGGLAKGQIVRDIDALGGLMGVLSDQAGIQFRTLNLSKGPAVHGPRAQQDMDLYSELAKKMILETSDLTVLEGILEDLHPHLDGWRLKTQKGEELFAKKVIITTGTFLGGMLHIGLHHWEGGRYDEPSAMKLTESFSQLKIPTRRLKTGTPSRLKFSSLDESMLEIQYGDKNPLPFSFRTTHPLENKATCWITRTSAKTHEILKTGFDRSPMYTGKINGVGPRYCPSIEDKVNRFADRDSHQLFLEPQGLNTDWIYVNGFSSSLPEEVQDAALRTLPGLEHCEVYRYGYAVEYEAIYASELHLTLEHRHLPGLYFAGQVNGTSGYEEAAAQGLIAGINSVLSIQKKEPFILGRSESYIGVMIDDLVHREIDEPYRMFTSRAEYRLFLRSDNAESRLLQKGRELGLIDDITWGRWQKKSEQQKNVRLFLKEKRLKKEQVNSWLNERDEASVSQSIRAEVLVNRSKVELSELLEFCEYPDQLGERDLTQLRGDYLYAGYFERQEKEIQRQKRLENSKIPAYFDWSLATALSFEARSKLLERKPLTVGEAARIPGVRNGDVSAILYYLDKGLPKATK